MAALEHTPAVAHARRLAAVVAAVWLCVAVVLGAYDRWKKLAPLDTSLAYSGPIAGRLDAALGVLVPLYEALETRTPPNAVIVHPLEFDPPDLTRQFAVKVSIALRCLMLPRELVANEIASWPEAAQAASRVAPVFVLDTIQVVEPGPHLESVATGAGFALWRFDPAHTSERDG